MVFLPNTLLISSRHCTETRVAASEQEKVIPTCSAYWQEWDKDVYFHHFSSSSWLTLSWEKTTEGHDFGIMWGQKKLADLDFADDLALLCHTQQALQDMTDRLHLFGKKAGLRIGGKKTKAMTVGNQTSPPITLEGQNIEKGDKFQYLGSYLSENGDVEVDIRARLGKASSVFQRLQPVWKCSTIQNDVKLRLYSSIVIPTGIYASEMWKTTNTRSSAIAERPCDAKACQG